MRPDSLNWTAENNGGSTNPGAPSWHISNGTRPVRFMSYMRNDTTAEGGEP
jgi:hypothetical protein